MCRNSDESRYFFYIKFKNSIVIFEKILYYYIKENAVNTDSEGGIMGKIITIKNNKGGVGKTFLSTQLAAGFALMESKVLIITSDSQNNVFDYMLNGFLKFTKGLKAEVSKKDGEYFRMRSNLYFLPLEDNRFSNHFLKSLPEFLERVKTEYDYVIIDSTAVLKLDEVFLKQSDSIIIPTFADEVTTKSVISLINSVDIKKVKAVVTNKYKATKTQEKYYNNLTESLENFDVLVSEPIAQVAFLEEMFDNKKTIWEFSNKTARSIQQILISIMKTI